MIRRSLVPLAALAAIVSLGSLSACSQPEAAAHGPASSAAPGIATVTATATATAPSTSELAPTPRLASADNFRDVAGGKGYRVDAGGSMARGVVYRSNALALSDSDLATVSGLGVATVIDLRTPGEIEATPDRVPDGAAYLRVNLLGEANVSGAMPELKDPAQAATYLVQANRTMVTSAVARDGLRQVLLAIKEASGPVIVHCSAGKDRAGFVSAMLQSIAGVSRDDIQADYLLTNERTAARIDAQLSAIAEQQGDEVAAAYRPLLTVSPEFIDAAFDQITADWGSVEAFLTDGVGLSATDLDALRTKLTHP